MSTILAFVEGTADDFQPSLSKRVRELQRDGYRIVGVSHSSALGKHEVGLVSSFSAVIHAEKSERRADNA